MLFFKYKRTLKIFTGNSLAVQWLGPCTFTAEGLGSIPGRGTKILQAAWPKPKKISQCHYYIYNECITSFFFFNFFLAVLGLCFCARAFSSCGKRGPLFIAVHGPLTIVASLVAEHRLQTRRLSNCGSRPSCSAACGILPDQGSNLCPLHWQVGSQPLCHQGSP